LHGAKVTLNDGPIFGANVHLFSSGRRDRDVAVRPGSHASYAAGAHHASTVTSQPARSVEAAKSLQGRVGDRATFAAAIQKLQLTAPRGRSGLTPTGVATVTFMLGKFQKQGSQLQFRQVKSVGTIDSKGLIK
jgi:hypothetical protein